MAGGVDGGGDLGGVLGGVRGRGFDGSTVDTVP